MKLWIPLLYLLSLVLVIPSYGAAQEGKDLTGVDLLAEYEKLIPVNQALREGHWDAGHYPRTLGTFNSKEVKEVYWCGDVCPQYGSVNIIYSNVKVEDCAAIGHPVYSNFWGRRYQGCTPLISMEGRLVDKGFSWSIAYLPDEDRTKPSVEEPLLFDDSSLCKRRGKKISCGEFHNRQGASIKATRSGYSLAVVKLDL
jgi:hypothetical protein